MEHFLQFWVAQNEAMNRDLITEDAVLQSSKKLTSLKCPQL